jgi:hypothetical protein
MMDANELLHLGATLASYAWDDLAIVVEIGAYVGRTTVFMAQVLRLLGLRIPILGIDPFERALPDALNPRGIYAEYLNTVQTHQLTDVCLPLVAFSQDAAAVVPDRIGVLVVDGGHHYPSIARDLDLYAPKLLPGGFAFIDDYGAAYPDVVRAVDEYFTPEAPFSVLHRSYFVIARRHGDTRGE